ncbi:TRAP transporter substrate-binding protein [Oribacterium sp. P6A1]|uniref:TRAP transporter substrate-binding protein n=1 Tax=Oribacterium sp. P6A1 TaxID=1410612 RepID=UPI0005663146|nr:TRAP transporter substrate-binding protein [Oribacterium sp. P6A1]
MKKRLTALVLSALMAASLAACGGSSTTNTTAAPQETKAQDAKAAETQAPAEKTSTDTSKAEYTLTLGHINAESDSWHQGALAFKEYVEDKSNGRIAVEIYPNSQLGSEVEMITSILQQSGCDITFTGESMQTYEPDLGMIGMPYLIQSDEQMEKVLTGEPGKHFEELMENAGLKVIGYFTRGPRYITSNKKIEKLSDMQNLLIRTPQSPMTVAAFEATGAKPTPMALSEVFTSLQQGTIEAQENPLAMIETQSFYEVQKYLIKTAHLRAWVYIGIGKAQFDALPEDLQQVVMDGGKHAQEVEHALFLENEEKYEKQLQEQGMEFVDVDVQEFADAMINGVLPTLTDSQKAIYESIEALK